MADKKFEQWVHMKITDKVLAEQLDAMAEASQQDRSKFLRWLIQQEWNRRNSRAHWVISPEDASHSGTQSLRSSK